MFTDTNRVKRSCLLYPCVRYTHMKVNDWRSLTSRTLIRLLFSSSSDHGAETTSSQIVFPRKLTPTSTTWFLPTRSSVFPFFFSTIHIFFLILDNTKKHLWEIIYALHRSHHNSCGPFTSPSASVIISWFVHRMSCTVCKISLRHF